MNHSRIAQWISLAVLVTLIAFVIADFGILMVRKDIFPTKPKEAPPAARTQQIATNGSYTAILERNIFNSDQKIASKIGAGPNSEKGSEAQDAAPVPSNLPIQLMGTIVHVDPRRSIATVNLRNKNEQVPVKTNGVIPDNLATVVKIERNQIIFRNMQTQRLEFIDMKDESRLAFGAAAPIKPQQTGEVFRKSETEFELKRDDINRLTSNLPELLQQARAVPRMNSAGQIECFSLADIAPGSIYERLGLRRGDCIKSVNGEKIDSPAKAMELYNALRASANSINLGVERDGRDNNMNYNIQ
jgi:general secretion pathway protein C